MGCALSGHLRAAACAARSNAKYPLALMSGFLPPDDNIATLHGARARRFVAMRAQP